MKPLYLNLLLVLILSSCYNPTSIETIDDLKALEGNWESYKGVLFNENWSFINDNLIKGEGFSLNGVDTSFFESLSIVRVNDSVFYRVGLKDNNESVDFLLVEAKKNSWLFTNPDNEFPSKIFYEIEEDNLLTVTISDMEVNKKQLFYLKKK